MKLDIDTKNDLGGIELIGFGSKDDFYIMLEELSTTSTLQVDRTVRHYDATGKLLGVARSPVADQFVYVRNNLSLGSDGSIYALKTIKDSIEVLILSFAKSLGPILPISNLKVNTPKIGNNSTNSLRCTSRDSMVDIATSYINNSQYLTSTNINGSCSERNKPRYLGSAGTYSSVPYDWGGYDDPATFDSAMETLTPSSQAGDIDNPSASCSRGVDCAGFVSRSWGYSYSLGTCNLASNTYSTEIYDFELAYGDILVICDEHTVLFYYSIPALPGIAEFESTTLYSYDRVVFINEYWSRFTEYSIRKSNDVCG